MVYTVYALDPNKDLKRGCGVLYFCSVSDGAKSALTDWHFTGSKVCTVRDQK